MTLGFVVLNRLIHAFWWDKRQNVGVPVYLEWISLDSPAPDPPKDLTKISAIRDALHKLMQRGVLVVRTLSTLAIRSSARAHHAESAVSARLCEQSTDKAPSLHMSTKRGNGNLSVPPSTQQPRLLPLLFPRLSDPLPLALTAPSLWPLSTHWHVQGPTTTVPNARQCRNAAPSPTALSRSPSALPSSSRPSHTRFSKG